MSQIPIPDIYLEPERYELHSDDPPYRSEMARREFFKVLGGGIVVLFTATSALAQRRGGGRGGRQAGADTPSELGAWLHIDEEGAVTVYTGKAEVGQNIRTSLTQVVAEELPAPLDSIRLVMGDTDLTPYDRGTFGSRTTPTMAPQLRKAAAAARELLIELAAERWNVERDSIVVADGKVTHRKTDQSLDFGQLTKGQKLIKTIGEDAPTTPAKHWKIAGTSVPKVNARDIVTGRHHYTSDVQRNGMLHGRVLRPSTFSSSLVTIDIQKAEAMKGVTVVRDGDFIGVVAQNKYVADRAIEAIQAEWRHPSQPSHEELFDYFKQHPVETRGWGGRSNHTQGAVEEGLEAADITLEGTYTAAYIAHAPLEPRAALAEWDAGKLTVWTGTQRPFGVRGQLAEAFGIPEDRVRVIMPDTGSGYGGKHTGEAAIEATRLAKAVGKPVKLVWTREEEFTWAYFRPAGLIEVHSGVKADGTLTTWEYHNYNSGGSAIRTPYEVPNQKIQFHPADSPLRQGSYRALAATANVFARETHMDELANALEIDPLEFRLKNLKDARLKAVFEAAAERFGWEKRKTGSNQGAGIAGGIEKGGYIATCAEVQVDPKSSDVKIVRVVAAFECGAILNPDGLVNQVEGSIIMGIGGALFEAIEFENGAIKNPRFSDYQVPRFRNIPPIETVLLDRKDLPSAGGGETPIVAIAPSIGNAIFDATGIRHRSLPMRPNERKI